METPANLPISHTKVVVPRRRDEILTRPRLLDLLFNYLDKKLILVSAPAGSGKTSLLIDLSHHSELPTCWVSLDNLDQDPQRFTTYLIESIAERFPSFGNQTRSLLKSLSSFEDDSEKLLVTLVNEVYDKIPQHFILVLDDYHLVNHVPTIRAIISRFLQLVDENCHMIISSRALTNLHNLPLMVAHDQVGGLDFSELAFQPDEIQKLFSQKYDLKISASDASKLVRETEGWITGVQLSKLGTEHGVTDKFRAARAAGVNLFDYLGQQVLDQQPQDTRLFLLRSSLLEEFDASFCESVLGPLYSVRQDWQARIRTILQSNLFTLPIGSEGGWVRYHHLFSEFLKARLVQERTDEVSLILENLAAAYEARNEWERAYDTQKRLGDTDALASLIERAAPHLMSRAMITLDSWLSKLPPSVLAARPGILSIRGAIAYSKGSLLEGLELLNKAERIFRESDNLPGLALTLVRRATVYRFLGDYQAVLHDANEVLQLTEASDELQLINAYAMREKGLGLFYKGQSRQSVKILERALNAFIHIEDAPQIPFLMMETGMAYRALGRDEDTLRLYDQALQIWKEEGNLSAQANLMNNLGVLYYLQGKYEKALSTLEEGLLCAQRSKNARMKAMLFGGMGDIFAEAEDFKLALQSYQTADKISDDIGEKFLANYLTLAKVKLFIQQNKTAEAQRLLDAFDDKKMAESSQYESGLYSLLRGRLWLISNACNEAINAFKTAETCFDNDGRSLECAWSRVWLAAAYCQADNPKEAKQAIREFSSAVEDGNLPHSVLVAVHQALKWLELYRNDPEVGQMVHSMLEQADFIGRQLPAVRRQLRRLTRTIQTPDARILIQAFGSASVSIGGKTLSMSDWQTQSVRDLFFYFLWLQTPATKEQVGDTLWPEIEEPSRLRIRFKNELYRLRRAVGKNVILFENENYYFNHNMDYEYDVEAFENYIHHAKNIEEINQKIELYKKAVRLVRGRFLEDLDAPWAWVERERLNQLYLSTLMTLINLLEKNTRYQEALDVCQRAIDYDPTYEPAYQKALQITAHSNNRSDVVRLYLAYVEAMQHDLDLPPSVDMQDLYQRLIR